ncbi:MAG: acetylornithine/succinylornithine family transaminase [Acidobacteriota bacterium]|nr:MAG: acetylornithine/succinylornithine family transaminase [Acidobacteriota bacterium]
MTDHKAVEDAFAFNVFPKRDLVIVRGKGATVWDRDGKAYIDCIAGHGIVNIGHSNEAVVAAIEEQASRLITCSGVLYNDTRARLVEKLVGLAPARLKRAFLCNSGTESVEAAIKFARFTTKKTGFVCAMRSFHGRTLGALSATHVPKYREPFEPLVPGFSFVPFNNFDKLEKAVADDTAAVMLEVVQGEGGVHVGEEDFFRKVQKLCRERGVLLIIDEVQTGFCRTGRMFAFEHFSLEPDMVCLAKAIAGGVPMGAVLCSDAVEAPVGRHGTTFGGNPLACAASIAALDFMIEKDLAAAAAEKGEYFEKNLDAGSLTKVREVRRLGLMIGIELKEKVKPHLLSLMEQGVLALPAGATVLRLLPPLTITHEELDTVASAVRKVLR